MPTKKKTATGPKAKLMKKNLTQLKAQAKKLKIKGFSTKKKDALVNSIMMAQARKKKTAAPKTKTRKISSAVKGPNAALRRSMEVMSPYQRKRVKKMYNLSGSKRMNRGMSEYNGWKNYETWYVNLHFGDYFQEVYDEYSLEGDYDFIFYSNYYKDAVEDLLLYDEAGSLMNDVQKGMINAFLSEVDYDEIAKHYIE